jgi:NAD(P)-dependent dehydrogenase (short-subunit alcohol dehydrogenase family)
VGRVRQVDRLAFVVGGTSGIGLATARLLAQRGVDVTLFGLPDGLREAADEVSRHARRGVQVRAAGVDVTSATDTEATLRAAIAEAGVPDLLVHCVGRARPRRFATISDAQFDETMKVNLYGAWYVLRSVVPSMQARGSGRIGVISSLLGLIAMYGYADYCASKAALIGLCDVLRTELAPDGIRVSVLCPPDTDTPGYRLENSTKPDETAAISSATHVMQPGEVAQAFLDGIERDRFLIVPRLENRLAYAAKRWLPRVVERYMLAKIDSVRRGAGA